jgi:hypothetical protein
MNPMATSRDGGRRLQKKQRPLLRISAIGTLRYALPALCNAELNLVVASY